MTLPLLSFSQYVLPGDTLVIGVSGGVDSMVLFDTIQKYCRREKIIVAHFDHSLRGAESDHDRNFVADICKEYDIIFEVQKTDIAKIANKEGGNIEAIGRRERYAFLESIRKKYSAKYILTAHHADDQVETILMNLIKGGKIRGLSGMQVLSGKIYRPLLGSTKKDILLYASQYNIRYREDLSNYDIHYDRNNIRHSISPTLININPNIHKTFGELAGYMQELGGFISQYVRSWLQEQEILSGKKNSFLISSFLLLDLYIQREIISDIYFHAHNGSTQGLSRGMIIEIIRFISKGSNSYGIRDIKNLHLERRGDRLYY